MRNRLTVRRRVALTHKEQTQGARDFVNEFLTHKKQTCGARDLMDKDYLMTVLTREDLAQGAKTGVNELTDVFMDGKVYGLE